jgi:hypothetical protein
MASSSTALCAPLAALHLWERLSEDPACMAVVISLAGSTPFVSAMGAGGRIDPTRVRVTDLSQTAKDPLAKVIRKELRARGVAADLGAITAEVHARDAADAARAAGTSRFRAIFLTNLTTFAGLVPIIFQGTLSENFLNQMSISIAFGVMFSFTVTLFLVPINYLVLDDISRLIARLRRPSPAPHQPASPASTV